MYAATGGPNVKWRGRAPLPHPPAGDGPAKIGKMYLRCPILIKWPFSKKCVSSKPEMLIDSLQSLKKI